MGWDTKKGLIGFRVQFGALAILGAGRNIKNSWYRPPGSEAAEITGGPKTATPKAMRNVRLRSANDSAF